MGILKSQSVIMSQQLKSAKDNLKCTPLFAHSFSKLSDSTYSSLTDSGYSSSLHSTLSHSITPSESSATLSRLYCSTPINSHFTSRNSSRSSASISHVVQSSTPQYSADRIPLISKTTPNLTKITQKESSNNLLENLMEQQTLSALKKIFFYLHDEDLLRLSQASNVCCEAVCNDLPTLRRLSRYVINLQQNCENRPVFGNRALRSHIGILRPIHNVVNNSDDHHATGAVWTIPSPLENIPTKDCPLLLRKLILMTRTLTDQNCVTRCHTCRCFVAARVYHRKLTTCSQCSQTVSRSNVHSSKRKINLFKSIR